MFYSDVIPDWAPSRLSGSKAMAKVPDKMPPGLVVGKEGSLAALSRKAFGPTTLVLSFLPRSGHRWLAV
jgi:hypothetical protein